MKTIAIFIFLALFLSQGAIAEKSAKKSQKRKGPDIDAFIIQIKLSDAKAEKFKAILKEVRKSKQTKAKKTKDKQSCEGTKEKTPEERLKFSKNRDVQNDAMDDKLLTVLSYKQLYKYRKYMRDFRYNRGMKNKNKNKKNGCK
jgi:hypothetical protein